MKSKFDYALKEIKDAMEYCKQMITSLEQKRNNDKDNKGDRESINEQLKYLDMKYSDLINNRIIINLRIKILLKNKNNDVTDDKKDNKQRNKVCGSQWYTIYHDVKALYYIIPLGKPVNDENFKNELINDLKDKAKQYNNPD